MVRFIFLLGLVSILAVLLTVPSAQAQDAAAPEGGGAGGHAEAIPTRVVVRALAHDAKLLQDPVGGARVVIRERETGRVLAEGIQEGSSGSTDAIMRTPTARGATVYDTPEAARFEATIPLEEPTAVEIAVEGPLDYPDAVQRASTTMLLVPGAHVVGDGVVLELYGFIVEVDTDEQAAPGASVPVQATVRMLCGCPTEPGGMWDADAMTVTARLVDAEGRVVAEEPLPYAGTTSTFGAVLDAPEAAGDYEVRVLVVDAGTANFGRDRQPLRVEAAATSSRP